ncbi:MAG: hypothetical protein ACKVZ0_09825 [Gemmatimonadales bacterium]
MRRYARFSTIVLATLAAAGCNESTTPGLGRAEALIVDPPAAAPTVAGSLAGNTFASISTDGTTWVDLGSPNGITVPLQAAGSATVHGEQDAPTGTYTRVRLIFEGVTARLTSGSVIGGTTLTSNVNLPLGGADQRVEVVVAVPAFTVDADAGIQRTIAFELRSYLWITAAALQAGTVTDATIQGAVVATTRVDNR